MLPKVGRRRASLGSDRGRERRRGSDWGLPRPRAHLKSEESMGWPFECL